jgi:hypothetical protein
MSNLKHTTGAEDRLILEANGHRGDDEDAAGYITALSEIIVRLDAALIEAEDKIESLEDDLREEQ